jgi:hypothetical protein
MEFEAMQTELADGAENTEVTTEVDLSAFDEGWEDDGPTAAFNDQAHSEEEVPAESGNADQQAEEDGKAGNTETDAEPEVQAEGADQRFVLKHLDEVREVGRDEVIALAQKGMDYDRKVQKLSSKNAEYEEFLKLISGPDKNIENMMDRVRAKMLVDAEKEAGRELDMADAIFSVQSSRAEKAKAEAGKEAADAQLKAETDKARIDKDIHRFIEAYPGVKAEEIPKSVWDEVNKGVDLTSAYIRHENAELKKRLQAMETNAKNGQRSTGSRKTAGSGAARDAFDEGWDSI